MTKGPADRNRNPPLADLLPTTSAMSGFGTTDSARENAGYDGPPYEEVAVEEDVMKRNGERRLKIRKEHELEAAEKPVVKALKHDTFLIGCHLLMAVLLTVCSQRLPAYLSAVNSGGGSAYGALVFVSLASCVIAWLLAASFLLSTGGRRSGGKHEPMTTARFKFNIKTGALLGLCGLIVFYSRDRERVPCHLQEPLTILFLPAVLLLSGGLMRGVKKVEVIFLMGSFFGLFLCVDGQLLDPAYCYGRRDRRGEEDDDLWSEQTGILWSIAYVGGVALFAHVHVALERFLADETKVSDSSVDQEVALLIRTKKIYQKLGESVLRVAWIQTFALVTVLGLFWTDIFSALGKAGSIERVGELVRSTFRGHFEDVRVVESGWSLVPCYVLFLLLLTCTLPHTTMPSIAVTELSAVPLTIFVSSITRGFVPETGFAVVGFVLLLVSVLYYYLQGVVVHGKGKTAYEEI